MEWWARVVLRGKGYIPVAHRCRTPYGEIDLIYVHGNELVFIEVKYRRVYHDAHTALTDRQRARIARAGEYFREQNYLLGRYSYRFDEFIIWGWGAWSHIHNTSQMEKNTA